MTAFQGVGMPYTQELEAILSDLKLDGRYRSFVEIERLSGAFPEAL